MNGELNQVLEEWRLPEAGAALDARVMASFHKRTVKPAPWWAGHIRIPVPAFALLLLFVAAAGWLLRPSPKVPPPPMLRVQSTVVSSPQGLRYVTAIDAQGFKPMPDGPVTVIRTPEVRQ